MSEQADKVIEALRRNPNLMYEVWRRLNSIHFLGPWTEVSPHHWKRPSPGSTAAVVLLHPTPSPEYDLSMAAKGVILIDDVDVWNGQDVTPTPPSIVWEPIGQSCIQDGQSVGCVVKANLKEPNSHYQWRTETASGYAPTMDGAMRELLNVLSKDGG
jgi:hypothetical protein